MAFELRYWMRSWTLWIFLIVVTLMFFGAASTDQITVGQSLQNTYRNAAYVIQNFYAFASFLCLLMTTAFVNSAASRDFAYGTHAMVFSTPLRRSDYLLGRFFGSAVVSLIPILGVSIGLLAARHMPWIETARWGPVLPWAHLWGFLLFAIPNTLFAGALVFAIAAFTRSTVASFLGTLLLLTLYQVTQSLLSDLDKEWIAALLDPFAIGTYQLVTKYWTVSEKNSVALRLEGLMLWNRLLWFGVSGLIFAVTLRNFRFEERTARPRHAKEAESKAVDIVVPAGLQQAGWRADWAKFLGLLRIELLGLIKSTVFIVILAFGLLNTIPSLFLEASEGYGNHTFPVTYWITNLLQGRLYLFLIAMIIFYAGALVWKDRDTHMDDIADAVPQPGWAAYLAKFSTLVVVVAAILVLSVASGILAQTWEGYHRYQLDLYLTQVFVRDLSQFVFLIVLALFCHVVMPNKFLGYFLYLAILIANFFAWNPLDIETRLVQFGGRPEIAYSDFYGYATDLVAWQWFTGYWSLFCVLLAIASLVLWQRGKDTEWAKRWREARRRFDTSLRLATAVTTVAFFATGGWIYYNTKVLNHIEVDEERRQKAVDYEKTYKKQENLPQPRITAVRYDIDLRPETREMTMLGEQTIEKRTNAPIAEIHVLTASDYTTATRIDKARLEKDDTRLRYRVFRADPPIAPGEKRQMRFTVSHRDRGFENSVMRSELLQNGSFFNSRLAPQIRYQSSNELDDKNERRKKGLGEKSDLPELERDCTEKCRDAYISNNADWVMVETVIRTAPDQIAIAPGSLLREWMENGRRCFEYRLDRASLNFYSFLSARYEVAREQWNDVKLEVYYLKDHPWNVPKMLASMRKTLDYATRNFGPYRHKQARIIEFPRVARFAQAFPGTMPYSEAIGFIANLKDPENIDHVFYVVAHEIGHQWWAHQAIGAAMQGATLLSETMAQYTALMVMEKEYGRDIMRKFLRHEMDNYLRSRGAELLKERPLLTVDAGQGYVHYRKGSVVMYLLKETIGEAAINRALRRMIECFGYQGPPYPTSYALVEEFRKETPPEYHALLKDLFEDIVLFSNRTLEAKATQRPDGKFDLSIDVESKKFKADPTGAETEVPVEDWIEIGAFAKPDKDKKYGRTLYRQRLRIKGGTSRHTFTVEELPDQAGIDPFNLLIDRVPEDNLKRVSSGAR